MSFVGQLGQFHLPDLLQMIATTAKSGKLSLTRRDGKGVVVFRGGKIIYAATTSLPREALGSALIGEGLLDAAQLQQAIELQRAAPGGPRLGTILTREEMVPHEELERVVQQQVERVIADLLEWRQGFFRFELLELPPGEEIEVDTGDFLLEEGLGTEQVLLSIAVQLDELEKERSESGGGPAPVTSRSEAEGEAEGEPADAGVSDLASLQTMMSEVRSPAFTGEMTSEILDFARDRFARGVLFTVGAREFRGIGGFGPRGAGADSIAPRDVSIPAGQPSVLREVVERGESYSGEIAFLPMNLRLLDQLGGGRPKAAAVLPLTVNGRVLLLFYADNLPDGAPLGSLAETELVLLQVGLEMEKRLLAERAQEIEMMRHLLQRG